MNKVGTLKSWVNHNINKINEYPSSSLLCIEPMFELRSKSGTKFSYKMEHDSISLKRKKHNGALVTEISPTLFLVEYAIHKKWIPSIIPCFFVGVIQENKSLLTFEELKVLLEKTEQDGRNECKLAFYEKEDTVNVLTFDKNTNVVKYVNGFEFDF